jgi:hypothetical protein
VTLTDPVAGTDKLGFVVNGSYDAVKAAGAVPANLGGNLNSVAPWSCSPAPPQSPSEGCSVSQDRQ